MNSIICQKKSTLGKGKRMGVVFTDLINPLDTINHELQLNQKSKDFLKMQCLCLVTYSKVFNRRGLQNSRGGWEKYQKLIARGVGGGVGKTENFNSKGEGVVGFYIAFFFPVLTMKTIVLRTFVHAVKVKQKQNLEHFKMINRRLFIHKFCNNSKLLLSSSWAIFIRALAFLSSPSANFSSFEYLVVFFVSTNFSNRSY